ncbi:UDP-glucuronosyltransferase 2B1-like [Diadema setosum]|uniref:UDP-glucuronosyltransferase 2B1-like n=1 Tax=Diadema setosum TaxID=31175 RepID=UPI003B3B8D1E
MQIVSRAVFIWTSFLLLLLGPDILGVEGANILFYCGLGVGSVFTTCARLGEELVNRGHNVTALISNAYLSRSKDPKYRNLFNFAVFNHSRPVDQVYATFEWIGKASMTGHFLREFLLNRPPEVNLERNEFSDCDALLGDQALVGRLADVQYDAVIAERLFGCAVLLGDLIGARRLILVSATMWGADYGSIIAGSPNLLAVTPAIGSGLPSRMSFKERVQNVFYNQFTTSSALMMPIYEKYKRERNFFPGMTLRERYDRADLYLVNMDFSLEFPAAITPKVIPVGGLSTSPAKPLSPELEAFVEGSGEHGVIVFSFGTFVTHFREELVSMFVDAFARLPQRVAWHWRGEPPREIADNGNILTMEWIPQNDLLGHNKTRVFLYHGGNAGCYEALYHGVPVVVTPIFVDQPDVAQRIVSREMGVALDFNALSAEKIFNALHAVIYDKKFKESAKRQSAIFHHRPMSPLQRAAFWTEHVIKHGGEYMRTPANNLPWYQYYLLDVMIAIFTVTLTLLIIIFYVWVRTRSLLFEYSHIVRYNPRNITIFSDGECSIGYRFFVMKAESICTRPEM